MLGTRIGGCPSELVTPLGAILARVFRVVFEGTFVGKTGSFILFSGSLDKGLAGAVFCGEDQVDSGATDSPCLISMVMPKNSAS
jgi:hypothetical protein